jgi:hypothetical protein
MAKEKLKLKGEKEILPNPMLPAVNFTDFCKRANLAQIKKALRFYNEPFKAEKVLEYFANWTIVDGDRGKILVNKHSNGEWETTMTFHDNVEYTFAEQEKGWQYVPKTFSEFISDVLRYEDFDLLLSEKGRRKVYGR